VQHTQYKEKGSHAYSSRRQTKGILLVFLCIQQIDLGTDVANKQQRWTLHLQAGPMKESRAKHRQNKNRASPGLFLCRQLVRKAEGWTRTILSVPGVEVHQLLGQ